MSRLNLLTLGPPRIELDSVPIKFATQKTTALLIYLALTHESHSRNSLVNLLWPDYDQSRARTVLRRTLYALSKAFPPDWLEADRETIGISSAADIGLDVNNFHSHLAQCKTHDHSPSEVCSDCLSPLTEAVELYRDDFLSGFSLLSLDKGT